VVESSGVRPSSLSACAVGEWTCAATASTASAGSNRFTASCRSAWRIEPEYAIKVDSSLGLLGVLLEPTTVIAKALEQVVFIAGGLSGNRGPCW